MAKGQKIDDLFFSLGVDLKQLELDFATADRTVAQSVSKLQSETKAIKLKMDTDLTNLKGVGSELDKIKVKETALNDVLKRQQQQREILNQAARQVGNQNGFDSSAYDRAAAKVQRLDNEIAKTNADIRSLADQKIKVNVDTSGTQKLTAELKAAERASVELQDKLSRIKANKTSALSALGASATVGDVRRIEQQYASQEHDAKQLYAEAMLAAGISGVRKDVKNVTKYPELEEQRKVVSGYKRQYDAEKRNYLAASSKAASYKQKNPDYRHDAEKRAEYSNLADDAYKHLDQAHILRGELEKQKYLYDQLRAGVGSYYDRAEYGAKAAATAAALQAKEASKLIGNVSMGKLSGSAKSDELVKMCTEAELAIKKYDELYAAELKAQSVMYNPAGKALATAKHNINSTVALGNLYPETQHEDPSTRRIQTIALTEAQDKYDKSNRADQIAKYGTRNLTAQADGLAAQRHKYETVTNSSVVSDSSKAAAAARAAELTRAEAAIRAQIALTDAAYRANYASIVNGAHATATAVKGKFSGIKNAIMNPFDFLMSGKGMALMLAGGGLFSMTDGAMKAGQEVYKLQNKLHMTTAEAGQFSRIFKIAGIDINSVIPMFARLDNQVLNAGVNGNDLTVALQNFGVSLTDNAGNLLPYNEQLKQLAEGYQRASQAGQAEAYTSEVLGARGAMLVPLLEQYNDALEISNSVHTTGLLDPEEAHKLYIQWSAMKIEAGQLGGAIGAALMPVAQDMMPGIRSGLEEMIDDIRRNKTEIEEFAGAVGTLAKAFGNLALVAGKSVNAATDVAKGATSSPKGAATSTLGLGVGVSALGIGFLTAQPEIAAFGGVTAMESLSKLRQMGIDKRTFDQETHLIDPNNKMDAMYMKSLVPGAGQYSSLAGTKDFKEILRKNSDAEINNSKAKLQNKAAQDAARQADERRKAALESLNASLYKNTHNELQNSLHEIDEQSQKYRDAGVDESKIDEENAARKARVYREFKRNVTDQMNTAYLNDLDKSLAGVDSQADGYRQQGASETEVVRWQEAEKARIKKQFASEVQAQLDSVYANELEKRIHEIEREKQAWIDKGMSEVQATQMAEKQKQDAYNQTAESMRSIYTGQKDAYKAWFKGENMVEYLKRKDGWNSSVTAENLQQFQKAMANATGQLYGYGRGGWQPGNVMAFNNKGQQVDMHTGQPITTNVTINSPQVDDDARVSQLADKVASKLVTVIRGVTSSNDSY